MDISNILLILSSLGVGGVIGVFAKSFLDKRYRKFSEIFEFKQIRYKAIVTLTWVALNPSRFELKQLERQRPDIRSVKDLDREIEFEYHNAMLFASDNVLKALQAFNKSKTIDNWEAMTKAMKKDLYS